MVRVGPRVFTLLVAALTATFVWQSLSLGRIARLVPLAVGIPTLILLALQIYREAAGEGLAASPTRHELAGGHVESAVNGTPAWSGGRRLRAEYASAGWLTALLAGILLLGFQVGAPVYVFAYVRIRARLSWTAATALAVGAVATLRGFGVIVPALQFQEGMLRLW